MGLTLLPNPGQSLLSSRSAIRNNFSVISTAFEVDHVAYNASGQGFHNKVTLVPQGSDPNTTGSDNIALYSKDVSGVTQLFLALEQAGGFRDLTSSGQSSDGWGRLPSGILFKWGSASYANTAPNTTGNLTVTYPTGASIPVFTAVYTVMVTPTYTAANTDPQSVIYIKSDSISATDFIARCLTRSGSFLNTPHAATFYYLAIGIG